MTSPWNGFVAALALGLVATAPGGAVRAAPIDPASVEFGRVTVATTSAPTRLTYTNQDSAAATLSLAITGANASEFAIGADTCRDSALAVGAPCTVDVTFTPRAELARKATLEIRAGSTLDTVALRGTGILPPSKVSWGPIRDAAPDRFEAASGLAATQSSSGTYLQLLIWTGYDDTSRLYHVATTSDGSSWTPRVRLNSAATSVAETAIAASGSRVYATWTETRRDSGYDENGPPAVLMFRTNADHGTGTWSPIRRLTARAGSVGQVAIAATGRNVHIAYVDGVAQAIYVNISSDQGATWRTVKIASLTQSWINELAIAASGASITVAWLAETGTSLRARTSTDNGSTWGSIQTVGTTSDSIGNLSIAMLGDRTAIAWEQLDVTPSSTWVRSARLRLRIGSTWGPIRSVVPSPDEVHASRGFSPAVALAMPSRVGIAFSAGNADDSLHQVVWRESADNGVTWAHSQIIAGAAAEESMNSFGHPSVAWPTASRRYLLMWRSGECPCGPVVRTGSGSP